MVFSRAPGPRRFCAGWGEAGPPDRAAFAGPARSAYFAERMGRRAGVKPGQLPRLHYNDGRQGRIRQTIQENFSSYLGAAVFVWIAVLQSRLPAAL
jgi:hypothetical protein